jgi:hypothetical protein
VNRGNGFSEIEGKAVRVTASERGQRTSFKSFSCSSLVTAFAALKIGLEQKAKEFAKTGGEGLPHGLTGHVAIPDRSIRALRTVRAISATANRVLPLLAPRKSRYRKGA